MPTINTVCEGRRGCGYRKPGGFYVMGEIGFYRDCGRLPIPITTCPCCGTTIKFSRAMQMLDGDMIIKMANEDENPCSSTDCQTCHLSGNVEIGKVALMWVGEKFYPHPSDFTKEADAMGVSKRIPKTATGLPALPKEFKVGETLVFFAHKKTIATICDCDGDKDCEKCEGKRVFYTPGVFRVQKLSRIEYVVTGTEDEEFLEKLEERGITLVNVKPVSTPGFFEEED